MTTDTAKRLSDEDAGLVKAFRNRAKSIRDWCAEHKAEEWAPMAQFEASLKEADDWDRAADAIERLSAPPSQGKAAKVLQGLRDAIAGNFARVTIEGETWTREPAQGTSVDGAEGKVLVTREYLRNIYAALAAATQGKFDTEFEVARVQTRHYLQSALPLPVSEDGRDAVIEECAWRLEVDGFKHCAATLRALKSKQPSDIGAEK